MFGNIFKKFKRSGKDGKEAPPEKESPASTPHGDGASPTGGGTGQKNKPIPSSSQSKSPVTHQIHSGLPQQQKSSASATTITTTSSAAGNVEPDKTPWRRQGKAGAKPTVSSLISHSLSPTPTDSTLSQNIEADDVNKTSDSSSINSRGGRSFRDEKADASASASGSSISQVKDDKGGQKTSLNITPSNEADLDRRKSDIPTSDGASDLLPPPSSQPLSRTTAIGVVTRGAAVPKYQKKDEQEKSFEFGTTYTPKKNIDDYIRHRKQLEQEDEKPKKATSANISTIPRAALGKATPASVISKQTAEPTVAKSTISPTMGSPVPKESAKVVASSVATPTQRTSTALSSTVKSPITKTSFTAKNAASKTTSTVKPSPISIVSKTVASPTVVSPTQKVSLSSKVATSTAPSTTKTPVAKAVETSKSMASPTVGSPQTKITTGTVINKPDIVASTDKSATILSTVKQAPKGTPIDKSDSLDSFVGSKPSLLVSQSKSLDSQDLAVPGRSSRKSLDDSSSREGSRSRRRSDELNSNLTISEIYAIEDPRARAAALAAIYKPSSQEPSNQQIVMTAHAKAALEATEGRAERKKRSLSGLRTELTRRDLAPVDEKGESKSNAKPGASEQSGPSIVSPTADLNVDKYILRTKQAESDKIQLPLGKGKRAEKLKAVQYEDTHTEAIIEVFSPKVKSPPKSPFGTPNSSFDSEAFASGQGTAPETQESSSSKRYSLTEFQPRRNSGIKSSSHESFEKEHAMEHAKQPLFKVSSSTKEQLRKLSHEQAQQKQAAPELQHATRAENQQTDQTTRDLTSPTGFKKAESMWADKHTQPVRPVAKVQPLSNSSRVVSPTTTITTQVSDKSDNFKKETQYIESSKPPEQALQKVVYSDQNKSLIQTAPAPRVSQSQTAGTLPAAQQKTVTSTPYTQPVQRPSSANTQLTSQGSKSSSDSWSEIDKITAQTTQAVQQLGAPYQTQTGSASLSSTRRKQVEDLDIKVNTQLGAVFDKPKSDATQDGRSLRRTPERTQSLKERTPERTTSNFQRAGSARSGAINRRPRGEADEELQKILNRRSAHIEKFEEELEKVGEALAEKTAAAWDDRVFFRKGANVQSMNLKDGEESRKPDSALQHNATAQMQDLIKKSSAIANADKAGSKSVKSRTVSAEISELEDKERAMLENMKAKMQDVTNKVSDKEVTQAAPPVTPTSILKPEYVHTDKITPILKSTPEEQPSDVKSILKTSSQVGIQSPTPSILKNNTATSELVPKSIIKRESSPPLSPSVKTETILTTKPAEAKPVSILKSSRQLMMTKSGSLEEPETRSNRRFGARPVLRKAKTLDSSTAEMDPELAGVLRGRRGPDDEDDQGHEGGSGEDEDEGPKLSVSQRIFAMQSRIDDFTTMPSTRVSSNLATPGRIYKSMPGTPGFRDCSSPGGANIAAISPGAADPSLFDKLSSVASAKEEATQRSKRFKKARDDWRRMTQPVTVKEIKKADTLDSVAAFRAEVLKKASQFIFSQQEAQNKPLPEIRKIRGQESFPQPYRYDRREKFKNRHQGLRHKTQPVTQIELNEIPESDPITPTSTVPKSSVSFPQFVEAAQGVKDNKVEKRAINQPRKAVPVRAPSPEKTEPPKRLTLDVKSAAERGAAKLQPKTTSPSRSKSNVHATEVSPKYVQPGLSPTRIESTNIAKLDRLDKVEKPVQKDTLTVKSPISTTPISVTSLTPEKLGTSPTSPSSITSAVSKQKDTTSPVSKTSPHYQPQIHTWPEPQTETTGAKQEVTYTPASSTKSQKQPHRQQVQLTEKEKLIQQELRRQRQLELKQEHERQRQIHQQRKKQTGEQTLLKTTEQKEEQQDQQRLQQIKEQERQREIEREQEKLRRQQQIIEEQEKQPTLEEQQVTSKEHERQRQLQEQNKQHQIKQEQERQRQLQEQQRQQQNKQDQERQRQLQEQQRRQQNKQDQERQRQLQEQQRQQQIKQEQEKQRQLQEQQKQQQIRQEQERQRQLQEQQRHHKIKQEQERQRQLQQQHGEQQIKQEQERQRQLQEQERQQQIKQEQERQRQLQAQQRQQQIKQEQERQQKIQEQQRQQQFKQEQERKRQLQEQQRHQQIKEAQERQRQLPSQQGQQQTQEEQQRQLQLQRQQEQQRQQQFQQEQERQRQLQEQQRQQQIKREQERKRHLQEQQRQQQQLQQEQERQRQLQEQHRQHQVQEEQERQRQLHEQQRQKQLQEEQQRQVQLHKQQEQQRQQQIQQEQQRQRQLQQQKQQQIKTPEAVSPGSASPKGSLKPPLPTDKQVSPTDLTARDIRLSQRPSGGLQRQHSAPGSPLTPRTPSESDDEFDFDSLVEINAITLKGAGAISSLKSMKVAKNVGDLEKNKTKLGVPRFGEDPKEPERVKASPEPRSQEYIKEIKEDLEKASLAPPKIARGASKSPEREARKVSPGPSVLQKHISEFEDKISVPPPQFKKSVDSADLIRQTPEPASKRTPEPVRKQIIQSDQTITSHEPVRQSRLVKETTPPPQLADEDVIEDEYTKLSLRDKMQMFAHIHDPTNKRYSADIDTLQQQQDKPEIKPSRKFLERKKRIERYQTQPVTGEEVSMASRLAREQRAQQEIEEQRRARLEAGDTSSNTEEGPELEDEFSKMSLADKMRLFNTSRQPRTFQQQSSGHPAKRKARRTTSRFKTQSEEEEGMSAEYMY